MPALVSGQDIEVSGLSQRQIRPFKSIPKCGKLASRVNGTGKKHLRHGEWPSLFQMGSAEHAPLIRLGEPGSMMSMSEILGAISGPEEMPICPPYWRGA